MAFQWLNATMSERAPQNQDKFIVRLPDGMRDRIKAAAEANNRSMNAEIVAVLEREYPEPLTSVWLLIDSFVSLDKDRREGVVKVFEEVAERSDDPGWTEYAEAVTRVHHAIGDKIVDRSYRDWLMQELKAKEHL